MDKKSEIKAKLDEYKSLMGNSDAASEKRKNELIEWLQVNQSADLKGIGGQWSEDVLAEIKGEISGIKEKAVRCQMDKKTFKLIPWSFIAEEYFGKSAAWLSQRINGTPVRGKVYTLNDEQKATLNRALAEIGKFIGSYRIA